MLSIARDAPEDVLARGSHRGFDWVVMRSPLRVFRCGYIHVPEGHPWHDFAGGAIDADVHGGITWRERDEEDGGTWLGFDCAHAWDLPDPSLPAGRPGDEYYLAAFDPWPHASEVMSMTMWTQGKVEAACRLLCDQAADAVVLPSPDDTGPSGG